MPRTPSSDRAPLDRRRLAMIVAGVALVALTAAVAWQAFRPPERSDEAFCAELAQVAGLSDRVATEPDQLDAELETLRDAAAVAPEALATDVETMVGALEALQEGARRTPDDPAVGVNEALTDLQPRRAAIEAASASITAYAATTCGLQLGESTTGTSVTGPVTDDTSPAGTDAPAATDAPTGPRVSR